MKTSTNNILESLSCDDIKNLTSEVTETICYDFKKAHRRKFSAVDLWKLQAGRKKLTGRKFLEQH